MSGTTESLTFQKKKKNLFAMHAPAFF